MHMSHLLRPLGSIDITYCMILGKRCTWFAMASRVVGVLRKLPGPMARDQGRQWWWPDLVVCTHLTSGARGVCLCGGGGRASSRAGFKGRHTAAAGACLSGTLVQLGDSPQTHT